MTDKDKKQILKEDALKAVAGGVQEDSPNKDGGIIFDGNPGYIKTGGGGNDDQAPVAQPGQPGQNNTFKPPGYQ